MYLSAVLCFSSESRSILLPVVLHHIHLHLRQQRELLICSGILSSIFSIIKTSSMVRYSALYEFETFMAFINHVQLQKVPLKSKIPFSGHGKSAAACSKKSLTLLLSQYFSASSLRSLPSGVFCSGRGGDDGGEPPGCAATDAAVHHEQVALCGDVEGTTLSPVHRRDNGTSSTSIETGDFLMLVSNADFCFRAGGVRFLPPLAAPADD